MSEFREGWTWVGAVAGPRGELGPSQVSPISSAVNSLSFNINPTNHDSWGGDLNNTPEFSSESNSKTTIIVIWLIDNLSGKNEKTGLSQTSILSFLHEFLSESRRKSL